MLCNLDTGLTLTLKLQTREGNLEAINVAYPGTDCFPFESLHPAEIQGHESDIVEENKCIYEQSAKEAF